MTRDPRTDRAELRRRCQHASLSIEQVLEPAILLLFAQQEHVHGIEALMSRLAAAVGSEGRTRLNTAIAAASQHLDAVAGQFGFLDKVAHRLEKNALALRSMTRQQKQNMLMASMVATNAKVVSENLANRAESLSGFASRVKSIISEAQESAELVAADLARAETALGGVSGRIRGMTEAAHRLNKERAELPKLLDLLASLPNLQSAIFRSHQACRTLDEAMQAAILQLQCGDAVRQRLDHVVAMLDHPASREPETGRIIATLAERQMQAAFDALKSGLDGVRPHLDRIATASQTAFVEINALAGQRETAVFHDLAQLAHRMMAGLEDLDARRTHIIPAMESLSEAYAETAETTRAMGDLQPRMHLLGVNAMLVSSKIGTDGAAMTQVANHLRDSTGAIGNLSTDIVRAAQLQELNAILFSAPTAQATDPQTSAGLEAMRVECEEIMTSLAQTQSTTQLSKTAGLGPIRQHLSRLVRQIGPVGKARGAQSLVSGPVSPAALAILDEIRDSYTMEDERTLHDQLSGARRPIAPRELADVEDIFF
ncbi:hypothetical protein [Tropicibacter sp. S64]|uniref:hypothetical protein n=1 Tax=Tropicibacter sp. S64 TaxID=3415122 RepID=UPI003C7C1727